MSSLGDYYRELMHREGKRNVSLTARWARNEIRRVRRCFRRAFMRCHFERRPLVLDSHITVPATGYKLESHFAARIDKHLRAFKIQACPGPGYPDRQLVQAANRRSCPCELKATQSFEPKSHHRVTLTCSSKKLRRHFAAPINHLLLMVLYRKARNKVWIRNYRLNFLEPSTKVNVRLEASVSMHLLAEGQRPSFWALRMTPAKQRGRRN
jgi:hypothetical protein